MAKNKTSFTLSSEAIEALKKLAEKNSRSQSNMLDILILDAAKSQKIR